MNTAGGIARYVSIGARLYPARPALEMWGGPVRSYGELDSRTNRLANALLGRGLRRGSRIAVWMDNCLEYLEVYLAAAKAGMVVVPINVRYTAAEAGEILGSADVEALVFSAAAAGAVQALVSRSALRLLVGVGTGECDSLELEVLLGEGTDVASPGPQPDDPLVIGYTSGTTGRVKGAVLTHRSMEHIGLTNALACRYRLRSTQVFGMSLSFTATVPAHILPHLFVGGTTILHRRWDSEALVDCIARRHGDFLIVPSPALEEIAELLGRDPRAATALSTVLHSASKANPSHLGDLVEVLGDRVVEGWGMTENSGGLLTASQPGDLRADDPASLCTSGRAAPGVDLRVLSETEEQAADGVGMLCASAASLFREYWRDPAATAAAFRDGWFVTGDVGSIDADGIVTVVDRRADLINSGGMNVYPSEVERVLMDSGLAREVAVVGVAHPRWGQVPVAFVVPAVTQADSLLMRWAESRLASYKRPVRVYLRTELPRNTNGKVLRRRLAESAGPLA